MRLGKGVSLYGSLDPTGATRDEVYAVDLIAWGVIGYQIGRKREKIRNKFKKQFQHKAETKCKKVKRSEYFLDALYNQTTSGAGTHVIDSSDPLQVTNTHNEQLQDINCLAFATNKLF